MAKAINRDKKDRSRPWQKAATRSAILSAARCLVERSGAESLTLSAVGREAAIAPTTVYAYFANKTELFLAIVADDLAQFARWMGDEKQDAKSQSDAVTSAKVAPSRVKNQSETIGESAPSTSEQLAKLQEALARLETRPVDAWLERRLREFERGLGAIEAKVAGSDQAGAQLAIEESIRSLTTRVEMLETRLTRATDETLRGMAERVAASECQARQTQSDIDAVHARIGSRLDALENAAFAAAPAFFQAATSDEAPRVAAVAESMPPPAQQSVPAEDGAPPALPNEFLSAARRSAQEAQWRAATEKPTRQNPRRLTRRTLYWIAAGLAVLVGLIWTRAYVTAREVAALEVSSSADAETIARNVPVVARRSLQTTGMERTARAQADLMLGLALLAGPRRDDAAAAKLLRLSAQRGNALAALKLATLYRDGRGVPADITLAFRWNEVAANGHNCRAMYNLAVAYAEGWGTPRDNAAAVRWFAQAASLGMRDAQFNLGVMYERGLGVTWSPADAYKWYLIAAAQGDRQAELRVAALKPHLASTDLTAAEEAAAAFKAAPRDRSANEIPPAASSSAS